MAGQDGGREDLTNAPGTEGVQQPDRPAGQVQALRRGAALDVGEEDRRVTGPVDVLGDQGLLLAWLHTYNHHRGHTALAGKPPEEFLEVDEFLRHRGDATPVRVVALGGGSTPGRAQAEGRVGEFEDPLPGSGDGRTTGWHTGGVELLLPRSPLGVFFGPVLFLSALAGFLGPPVCLPLCPPGAGLAPYPIN